VAENPQRLVKKFVAKITHFRLSYNSD